MSAENFVNDLADIGKQGLLKEYQHANTEIHWAILYGQLPPKSTTGTLLYDDSAPSRVAEHLDPSKTSTRAAMWTNAIYTRGRTNSILGIGDGGISKPLPVIWRNTSLEGLASECQEALGELKPTLSNQAATIDIEKLGNDRLNKIKSGGNELLVFTGPNGVGKDFLISWLQKFLDFCQIPHSTTKMPNPDGPLFPTIDKFLHGQIVLNRDAAQLLFLSDALNTKISSATFGILNRHPSVESLVYGSDGLQPSSLALNPLFNFVSHVFIVDRHASVALDAVRNRNSEARIFERRMDEMLEQQKRFAALTDLPGHQWLNTDFEVKTRKEQIIFSVNRLLCMVQSCGMVQRRMIKIGLAKNFDEADAVYDQAFWNFKARFGLDLGN